MSSTLRRYDSLQREREVGRGQRLALAGHGARHHHDLEPVGALRLVERGRQATILLARCRAASCRRRRSWWPAAASTWRQRRLRRGRRVVGQGTRRDAGDDGAGARPGHRSGRLPGARSRRRRAGVSASSLGNSSRRRRRPRSVAAVRRRALRRSAPPRARRIALSRRPIVTSSTDRGITRSRDCQLRSKETPALRRKRSEQCPGSSGCAPRQPVFGRARAGSLHVAAGACLIGAVDPGRSRGRFRRPVRRRPGAGRRRSRRAARCRQSR